MSEIPKISRLSRYPELLRYKQESEKREERRRQKREDGWDKYSEMIKDQVDISGEDSDSVTETVASSRQKESRPKQQVEEESRPGVGENIDLFI
jgi:hypothetical protein